MTEQRRQRGSSIQRVVLKSGEVRWRFRLDLPPVVDENGRVRRRQQTITCKTEAEAIAAQAKARAQVHAGDYVEPDRATVDDVLDAWIAAKSVRWKPSTKYVNESALRPIRAFMGDKPVQRLRPEDVDKLVRHLSSTRSGAEGGRSGRSVKLAIQLLTAALDLAVRRGTVNRNVARGIELPRTEATERTTWSADELRRFLDAALDHRLAGAFALSTLGMRRGEVLGARWGDIDMNRRVIVIRESRVAVGADVIAGSPKSARGRREVPLHAAVIEALRITRERTFVDALPIDIDRRLIALDELGEPMRPDHYSAAFYAVADAAGLRRIRLHDVRHSVATLLLEAGQPPHVVAAVLGHDVRTLLSTYAHSNAVAAAAAVDALAGALGSVSDISGPARDIAALGGRAGIRG
ncbi:site-specific integrase [Agromyces italicus]|uniref:site-specific integrase n=1 Tax=Agromyces italicus TaxID=279572 RepID=UPI0003B347EA|nr:site-specific integrase [Agromyces italicus]